MSVSRHSTTAGVSLRGVDPLDDLDVRRGHGRIVGSRDPVLGAEVAVAGPSGWDLGHIVIGVGEAVVCAGGLGCHVVGELFVSDTRTAVGVLLGISFYQGRFVLIRRLPDQPCIPHFSERRSRQ